MARQFFLNDPDWGEMPVYCIREKSDGTWEREWEPFRTSDEVASIRAVLETVSPESYEQALSGWAVPMIRELGLPPEGCFSKLANEIARCSYRNECAAHDEDDCVAGMDSPACFSIGVEDTGVRRLANRIVEMWEQGIHVCLVPYQDE